MEDQAVFDEFESNKPVPTKGRANRTAPAEKVAPVSPIRDLLKPHKSIQIAAAGTVLITDLERRIIDTAAFQRLRRIKQLGPAYLVYPTAIHTRFDHSLGTLQIATEMIRAIRDNMHSEPEEREITEEQELVIRLYALLHDIPHVPFGHTIEDELHLLERHDENESRINHFLGPESEIGRILMEYCSDLFDRLHEVFRHGSKLIWKSPLPADWHFVHEIVSNTVCADLLDYLRRDDYFCDLGLAMRYRFLNFLYIDNGHLAIRIYKNSAQPRRDTLSDLCRLLENRYMIAERVYFHHAKIAAGAMLGTAIQIHSGTLPAGTTLELLMRRAGDDELISELTGSPQAAAREVAEDFKNRQLYKTLGEVTYEEVNAASASVGDRGADLWERIWSLNSEPETRRQLLIRYAEILDCPPHYLAIYVGPMKKESGARPERKMNKKDAEMRVLWKGKLEMLKEVKDDPHVTPRLEAVAAAHERLWSIALIGHPSLRGKKAESFERLFRADYVSASSEGRLRLIKDVLTETAEEMIKADNLAHGIEGNSYPQLKASMVEAGASVVGNIQGTGNIREAMAKAAQGFLGKG